MRNIINLVIASMLIATFAHAKTRTFPTMPRVINLADVTPDIIQEMLEVKDANIAIECKAGEEIPLEYLVNMTNIGFFSAQLDKHLTLKAEGTYYVRFYKQIPLMSVDLIRWGKPKQFLGHKLLTK